MMSGEGQLTLSSLRLMDSCDLPSSNENSVKNVLSTSPPMMSNLNSIRWRIHHGSSGCVVNTPISSTSSATSLNSNTGGDGQCLHHAHCAVALKQWDTALRELEQTKIQLVKVQQQRDEVMKEVSQAMALRIKATKDLARLTEERNSAVHEYSLVMSERDSVHKEIQKLQDDLTEVTKKCQMLEDENKQARHTMTKMKQEVVSLAAEKDKVLKQYCDLRELNDRNELVKNRTDHESLYSNVPFQHQRHASQPQNPHTRHLSSLIRPSALSRHPVNWAIGSVGRAVGSSIGSSSMAYGEEIEFLRQRLHKMTNDLVQCRDEAETYKKRRDWAISENKKIMMERESMRFMCDTLRKERNHRDRELSQVLRDNDKLKKQLEESLKTITDLQQQMQPQSPNISSMCSPSSSSSPCSKESSHNRSPTTIVLSNVDSKPKPGDVRDIIIKGSSEPLGINICCDEKDKGSVFVCCVNQMSIASQAGLQVGDQILDINGINMRFDIPYKVASTVLRQSTSSGEELKIRVQFNPDKFPNPHS